ncbi:ketopantoate reductase family protein [Pseudalkalibacillus hwajinpoensis]|uniref:ketopantoate reductase family protein n=1 Tax=Guptibacillus hwajinpoensis TaxID=208199 RepID=UPI001CD55864|nr:2-dehydropantoate 2-reductase [Pseudalkalibacillus hwajinpoensis]MCA0990540.1 2-dehydropantoate 2-reductase [Pseudalkalibacillus hwajinpoensis]
MKIGIAGTGAVGGYIGGILALANHEVVFLSRGTNLLRMQERGLKIKSPVDEEIIYKEFTHSLDTFSDVDLIILSVKSNDTLFMTKQLSHNISSSTPVLLMQNGVSNEEITMKYFDPARLFTAAVYLTSRMTEPGIIEMSGKPRLTIGSLNSGNIEEAKSLTHLFNEAGIQSKTSSNIMRDKWKKLLWNVTFNPLSAYAGVTVGQIINQPELREIAERALVEGMQIASHKGFYFQDELINQIFVGARKADNHYTSMLQDRLNGKQLEIESICGYFLKEATKRGISIPVIQSLYNHLATLKKEAFR